MGRLACAAVLLALPANAKAQQTTIDKSGYTLLDPVPEDALRTMATDRPNETNTPTTIDAGHLQIEAGVIDYAHDNDDGDRQRTWGYGELNFRLGVLDRLDLNIVIEPHQVIHDNDRSIGSDRGARGFGDIMVGGKLNLWGDDGAGSTWSTAFALQPQIKLPTAALGVGNRRVEYALAAPFQMVLPVGFNLSVQPSLLRLRNSGNDGYVTGYEGAVAIDHDIGLLDAYAEYVADDTSENGQPSQQTLDLGGTLPLGHNLVFDTGVNLGLTKASPDFKWLTGLSLRL